MVEHEKLSYGVIVEENNKFNVLLNNGNYICEKWFDSYKISEDDRCVISYRLSDDSFKCGGIVKGKLVVKPVYDLLVFNTENTFIAYIEDKSGYIDCNNGMEITPIIFSYAGRFKDGIAEVVYDGIDGYVTRNEYKLATANGIVYRFNILDWLDKNKEKVLKK